MHLEHILGLGSDRCRSGWGASVVNCIRGGKSTPRCKSILRLVGLLSLPGRSSMSLAASEATMYGGTCRDSWRARRSWRRTARQFLKRKNDKQAASSFAGAADAIDVVHAVLLRVQR